jgi:hypothetical protein
LETCFSNSATFIALADWAILCPYTLSVLLASLLCNCNTSITPTYHNFELNFRVAFAPFISTCVFPWVFLSYDQH